ncbi:hypothetical protein BC936DRAFT_147626 [Jimgerdemannia flammicorona]|uniref:Uncharacterized protein n=1 Tax=Jimgerdemannia flammicorona TaxID=994334 RepID=A0A433D4X2_9FUNG|nr:hypothetical protein BC936DRAFT_147626 [Jimgerdemannia flammicorona]
MVLVEGLTPFICPPVVNPPATIYMGKDKFESECWVEGDWMRALESSIEVCRYGLLYDPD